MGGKKKVLREIYRKLIEAVYAKWNASKISDVPRLMDKYKGQEDEIYDRIVRKYVFCRSQMDWQPLIEAMYRHFNPSKLKELDSIFVKYKDSEAALYRALCDKYLQTLSADNAPFAFNVWESGAQPVEVADGEASDLEVLDSPEDDAPPVRLVSPSPRPKEPEPSGGRTQSCGEDADVMATVPDAVEQVNGRISAEPAAPVAPTAPVVPAASLEAGLQAEAPKEEKKPKKKKKRPVGGEVFPPPLPRPPNREEMAGVNDFPDVILDLAQKRSNNSLRPKAAPRPVAPLPEEALDQVQLPEALRGVRDVRQQRNLNGESAEVSKQPAEGRRKKRRKVLANAAVGDCGGVADQQDPPLARLEPHARVSQTGTTLEQRRMELKEKLFELKTQISQAAPGPGPGRMLGPDPSQGRTQPFWGQPTAAPQRAAFGQHQRDPDWDDYSYSEDDAHWAAERQAEHRTVVLRNKLEAQLRAKLMNSMQAKVPEDA